MVRYSRPSESAAGSTSFETYSDGQRGLNCPRLVGVVHWTRTMKDGVDWTKPNAV